jgi:hypothetical protein
MALTKNKQLTVYGQKINFPNAYIVVSQIEGSKQNLKIILDSLTENGGEVFLRETYFFEPLLEGKNFIAQAYDYLKTLPEFSNAGDC